MPAWTFAKDRPHRCPRRGAGAGGETQIVPRSIVVDASVVLKWQLDDEEAVDQALAFRDDYLLHGRVSLVAPFLLVFELTNGMLSATRRRRLSRDQAEEGLALLVAAGIRLAAVDPARGVDRRSRLLHLVPGRRIPSSVGW